MSLFKPRTKRPDYFTLHESGKARLVVRMDDGAICAAHDEDFWTFPDDRNGWEGPLLVHLYRLEATPRHTMCARVLCAIMEAVQDLPENHTARVAVLESTIRELAEDTLANLLPESRRPTGSFPVFEALGKVLEAITICEEHP